jgi:peptidase E
MKLAAIERKMKMLEQQARTARRVWFIDHGKITSEGQEYTLAEYEAQRAPDDFIIEIHFIDDDAPPEA